MVRTTTDRLRTALMLLVASLYWLGTSNASAESRVVSAGGALTEIVYALGAERDLVGVDTTSNWPKATESIPKVGYFRKLSAEGLLSLRPTLVLTAEDAGPPEVLEQLRGAGVRIATFRNEYSAAGVVAKIKGIAHELERAAEGEELAANVNAEIETATRKIATLPGRPKVLFLLGVGSGAPVAAGRDTAAAAMIQLAGGENAFYQFDGYKPVSAEALVAAAPEVVLTTEPPGEVATFESKLLSVPGISDTPAGQQRRLVLMDGLRLLGFGPRLGPTMLELAERLRAPARAEIAR